MTVGESYVNLFVSLASETKPTNDSVTELCVLSFLAFMVLYGLAHAASELLVPHYRQLNHHEKVDWCTRVTSTTHALLTATAAFQVVVHNRDNLVASPFEGYSTFAKIYGCISIGYFTADLIVIVRHFKTLPNPGVNLQYIAHHVFGALGYIISMVGCKFFYFCMFRLMAEASTPFVNVHYLLSTTKPSKTKSFWINVNGVVMMLVYFVARIVALPYYWHVAVTCWHLFDASLGLKIAFGFFSLVGDVLNLYWFYRMIKLALGSVSGRELEGEGAVSKQAEEDTVAQAASITDDAVAANEKVKVQ